MVVVGVSVCALYWWRAGGSETLQQLLTPRFQVVSIDFSEQRMVLRQSNRTYTVNCDDACRDFAVGRSYRAMDRGSDLEIRVGGQRIRCPIIKIEVRFDVRPGGVG
ncbi:MAG: hypothetical protein DMG71_18315 [Acidobacteria bacterium]|nr:MAG: hypothetical protein DMG71_18315 [Acidobacteriota bacterium]